MGGSPKTPPKVDNSASRNQWVQSQNKARETQAANYNKQVSDWNAGLSTYLDQASSLRNQAQGLSILDDEKFKSLSDQVANAKSALSAYNWSATAPEFSSSVNSGISDDYSSGVVTLDVPTLAQANVSARNSGLSDLQAAIDAINALQNQRTAEQNKIDSTLSALGGRYSTYDATLRNMGLGDYASQRSALAGQIAALSNEVNSFSSSILSEYGTDKYNALKGNMGALQQQLADLDARYKAEQQRNSAFSTSLLNDISSQQDLLRKLTIADSDLNQNGVDDKLDVENQLTALRRQARSYTSELNPTFDGQLSEIDKAIAQLTALSDQRRQESARVTGAENTALQNAGGILASAQGADYYNLAQLQALQTQIANQRNQQQGFSTLLTGELDWTPANQQLDQAAAAISALIDQRNQALTQLIGKANSAMSGFGSLALENETGLNNLRQQLSAINAQLGSYSGNDLNDERAVLNDYLSQLDTRSSQLDQRRSDITNQAIALKNAVNNGSYYTTNDVSTYQQQLDALKALQAQFNASGASQYVTDIATKLNQEMARLQNDARNASSATSAEGAAVKDALNGSNYAVGSTSNLTDDEILQLLAGIQKKRRGSPGVQTALA